MALAQSTGICPASRQQALSRGRSGPDRDSGTYLQETPGAGRPSVGPRTGQVPSGVRRESPRDAPRARAGWRYESPSLAALIPAAPWIESTEDASDIRGWTSRYLWSNCSPACAGSKQSAQIIATKAAPPSVPLVSFVSLLGRLLGSARQDVHLQPPARRYTSSSSAWACLSLTSMRPTCMARPSMRPFSRSCSARSYWHGSRS